MALQWDFEKDFFGHMLDGRTKQTWNLYTGNALLIAVGETEEEYGLKFFLVGEDHLKNLLADEKGRGVFRNIEIVISRNKLKDKKVQKLISKLQGICTIKILGEFEPDLERKIYKLEGGKYV